MRDRLARHREFHEAMEPTCEPRIKLSDADLADLLLELDDATEESKAAATAYVASGSAPSDMTENGIIEWAQARKSLRDRLWSPMLGTEVDGVTLLRKGA